MSRPHRFARKVMQMMGSRSSALDVARGRIVLISCAFALSYIFVAARVADLSLIQGGLQPPEQAADAVQRVPAMVRADITDRNGVLLATSLETASLYADPALIPDPEEVARGLAKALPQLSYGDVLHKLQRKTRFIWLQRSLTPAEQYKVLELGHPGLDFQTEYRRIYPQERLAAHIAGYTDVDGVGLAGIERSFNGLLAKGGDALALTIDVRLQHILRRELSRAVADFSGAGGMGVIMDIASGEILAAVSLPDFDPHNPNAAGPDPLFNRLTLGVYEPGSTFKIFSTAALIELKNAPLSTTFDATQPLKRGRFTITDYHPEKRPMTVPEIFMHSSNIGAALMGEMVGTEELKGFYGELGFFEPLPLEIGEVGKPLIPHPWREINTLTASYGHGIAVSPLQVVTAAASIVGGGTMIRPTLVLDKNREKAAIGEGRRIVSPQTAHRMRQLMRLVVTDGTGAKADVPGYNVGGKTGTAEKTNARGGYDRGNLLSSFIGFFPMDKPRYAVLVMVDEPKGTKESFGFATGGWVAAPAAGKIISALGPMMGIAPEDETREDAFSAALKQYIHEASDKGGSVASQ